jgi:serine-type D-Ala-D-Ala carboxypeptidase (penicillin-binding protein 5/6)
MDASSGKILAQKNPDKPSEPASLTKMMTTYVIFDALKKGHIKLNDTVPVSTKAWRMPGSRMFIEPKSRPTVDQVLDGITVVSGNDASVAMAEYVAGTEPAFTDLMNQSAARLGMTHSHFTDSTGLPHDDHYSTPHDLAILARALRQNFPEYYHYFKKKTFTYNNIKQPNRNELLSRNDKVDGLKTGHTNAAGYCLTSSASYGHINLIAVVMGSKSEKSRTAASQSLLTWGARFFETITIYKPGQALLTPRVWHGKQKTVPLGVTKTVYVTIPKGYAKDIKVSIKQQAALFAPVTQNQTYAQAVVSLDQTTMATIPLVALKDDPKGGLWTRCMDAIIYKVHQWLS